MNPNTLPPPSRRQFVGTLTAALGGLVDAAGPAVAAGGPPPTPVGRPAPKLETPPAGAESAKLGWAVVGLGDFAQGYALPALARAGLSKPAGLVSGNPGKLAEVGARYAIPEARRWSYDTMGGMRDDPAVAVAYVVTPNSTHADLAVKCFEAGKHVLCEKPMATSAAACRRMIDAARAADRKLMIAYRVHWEPRNVRLKEMVDRGELGTVRFGTSDHHRPLDPSLPRDEWRMKKAVAGGGSLVDIGIYALNGLQWFFGESPSAVCATVHSPPGDPRFAEVESVVTAQLVFPSGRRANISSGYEADRKRIDLWGDKATALLDPATAYAGNRLAVSDKDGVREVKTGRESEAQFTGEIDHFSQVLRDGAELATPGEMGLRDMLVIEALYRSAAEGRWVALNPDMTVNEG